MTVKTEFSERINLVDALLTYCERRPDPCAKCPVYRFLGAYEKTHDMFCPCVDMYFNCDEATQEILCRTGWTEVK